MKKTNIIDTALRYSAIFDVANRSVQELGGVSFHRVAMAPTYLMVHTYFKNDASFGATPPGGRFG